MTDVTIIEYLSQSLKDNPLLFILVIFGLMMSKKTDAILGYLTERSKRLFQSRSDMLDRLEKRVEILERDKDKCHEQYSELQSKMLKLQIELHNEKNRDCPHGIECPLNLPNQS